MIAVNLLHPKSRGRISLNSQDIEDQPRIEPNYYAHPDDVRLAVEGAKLALEIGGSAPFKRIGARPYRTPIRECRKVQHSALIQSVTF